MVARVALELLGDLGIIMKGLMAILDIISHSATCLSSSDKDLLFYGVATCSAYFLSIDGQLVAKLRR